MPVVKKVVSKSIGRRPVLVEFDNSSINPNTYQDLDANLYQTQCGQHLVGVTSDKMLYTGFLQEDPLYNNFILVHKKDSNEIKLIQTDATIVRPYLQQTSSPSSKPKFDSSVSELNKQFGSKKAKRVTEQRERLTANISVAKEQLETTVSNIKLSESQEVAESNSLYRPKINRDASTPDGVYNLEDLVEAYILDTLAVEAGHIVEAGSADQLGLCPFSTASINKVLQSQSDEEEIIRRITIFLYINYLIKFMVTPMKSITKKFVVCDKSIDVNDHILSVFSEMGQSGRTRPLHMKDKALCYTMILAAIAMDFEVDIELLSKDLKIGIRKAIEVARILAFNSAKANNKHVVQLKVPLPAPIAYTPKRRKF